MGQDPNEFLCHSQFLRFYSTAKRQLNYKTTRDQEICLIRI